MPSCNVCSAARVIKKILTDDNVQVLGVTSVEGELFVLLCRKTNPIAVYSINDYQLLRHLHPPGHSTYFSIDLTSCVRHRCLYMSDHGHQCIHRYDLDSSTWSDVSWWFRRSKWQVRGQFWKVWGLSVTPSCNLLVICPPASFVVGFESSPWSNELVVLSADSGQCVRQISLQSDTEWSRHGVQLTTGHYVVCRGHRVCIVDDDGTVTRSYGGQCGSDVGQLNEPCHLAVDEDSQFIFVADCGNNRVVLLSPALEFVRYISEGLSRPYRLHIHRATRRLYVGQSGGGGVVVIQLT